MEIPGPKISRRRTLLTAFILASSALIYKIFGIFFAFVHVPQKRNSFGGVIDAGPLSEIPVMDTSPIHHPEGRFWLVNDHRGLRAIHSSCTHLDCLFTWDDERKIFICPCHGSEFDTDGTVIKGPATRPLDRFFLAIVNDSGKTVRDNIGMQGAAFPINDLLVNSEQEGKKSDEKPQSHVQLYLQVDTSQRATFGQTSF